VTGVVGRWLSRVFRWTLLHCTPRDMRSPFDNAALSNGPKVSVLAGPSSTRAHSRRPLRPVSRSRFLRSTARGSGPLLSRLPSEVTIFHRGVSTDDDAAESAFSVFLCRARGPDPMLTRAHAGDDVELPSAVDVEVAVVVGYDAGMVTLSLPIDDSLAKSLEETAKKSGLSTTEFVTETLRAALDDRRYRDAVDRGLAAVTAGRTIDSDVVERWLESWGSDDELEPPTCDG